jgi:predicted phage terminase large subunit-like protein
MLQTTDLVRTKPPKQSANKEELMMLALKTPLAASRELNNRSLYHFLQYFWDIVSPHKFQHNWHIELMCKELELLAEDVAHRRPRKYDLIINVPPGSTKSITCSHIFPAWCWSKWYWMRFITASYSSALAMESAEYCRDLIRSTMFQEMYPEIDIKEDKDTKSNFKIVKKIPASPGRAKQILTGGSRYSTSVGGTLTGFHGDILIVDDPLNPAQAVSDTELKTANRWCEQTLSTRKTDKAITPTIFIMQRLHQDDPSGHILAKQKENIRHISLPGECINFKEQVQPPELIQYYSKEGLLDPNRLPWSVLRDLEADLGQYGFAGQVGQNPTPPGGGMFKVDHFNMMSAYPHHHQVISTVRYWDKAASPVEASAFTVGVKMSRLTGNRLLIEDVKRGRWSSNERENIIKQTAEADGRKVTVWVEQEPGSGGKESAEATVRNLVGYTTKMERPTGDKIFRADPYSVQVNIGSVHLLVAFWNKDFIEEHRFFPFGTFKDQVDAASGAFNKLVGKKIARRIT